jgi:hypothetical protein
MPGTLRYEDANQRIFGIGQDLVIFHLASNNSYAQPRSRAVVVTNVTYLPREATGDRQIAQRIHDILDEGGEYEVKKDELAGFFASLLPPLSRSERVELADRVLSQRPRIGALQYRTPFWSVDVFAKHMRPFDIFEVADQEDDTSRKEGTEDHQDTTPSA